MKVYITYFRYDRDENYNIYNIDLNRKSSIEHFTSKDLPYFLGYGPDDVSYLVLKEVDLNKKELSDLIKFYGHNKDYDTDLIKFMTEIHHRSGEEIFFTSGDEIWEVLKFFKDSGLYDLDSLLGIDTDNMDDDDILEDCQEYIFGDDDVFDSIMKDYIKRNY